jgi:hypothetical protein
MATQESTLHLKKKMPMDFVLRLYDFVKKFEPVMGGGVREFKIAEPRPGAKEFIIEGNSWAQNKGPHQQIVGGYAITRDIPKAFWDEWLEQNKESAYIKNSMIFAHAENASTLAEAREKEDERSGLERLDPNKLPRGLQRSDDMKRAS